MSMLRKYRERCFLLLLEMNEPTYTWSGRLPARNYKNPVYSNKVFLGGVPWDITDGMTQNNANIHIIAYTEN